MKRYGTYKYTHPTYDGRGSRTYVAHTMHVEIVEEKGNRFHVRYLGQHPSGAALNSLHWCRKDKVREHGAVAVFGEIPKPTNQFSAEWRPDEEIEIRLPYKD